MNSRVLFTVARIAQELGRSRQSVYLCFAGFKLDGEAIVRGQRTSGWMVASFPKTIFEELDAIRMRKQFRSIADLLAAPLSRYRPAIPFAEVTPAAREKALKLQHAQRPFLLQRNSAEASREEFARRGVEDYRRIFGYPISPRHWRALLERTIARDAEREEWDFPDLYLPEKPARTATTLPISIARACSLEVLEDAVAELSRKGPLNVERKDYLWTKVCDQLEHSIEKRSPAKKAKRAILKVLLTSGLLGANKETIRRNLDHHWRQYCANGRKLIVDRRRLRRKEPLPELDQRIVSGFASATGHITTGWELARESGELSAETDQRYATNAVSVPHRVRRACGPVVQSVESLTRGARSERADGPSQIGDYSNLWAGEKFEMDDWTPENLCFVLREDGRPRFLQGQVILVIDVASRRILEMSFTEGAYSARMIRVTLNRACANYCLPDLLNIENGLWKRSRLIVGSNVIGDDQWEMGLREFMAINHAKRPQAKAQIENIFNALGKLMRTVPAWCGNDMRVTMPRDLQEKVTRAQSGALDPYSFCLHKDQMLEAITNALVKYNSRPQPYSRVLNTMSPNEAWTAKQSQTGRPSLGDKAAYLLAYHREPMMVRKCQVVKNIGGIRHVYHSPEVARFDRRKVLIWWNPDDLSSIAISSLDRQEGPFIVPRQKETPVIAQPDWGAVGAAEAKIEETLDARRVVYRSIQPWIAKAHLRPTLTDRSTTVFGKELEDGAARVRQEQSRQRSRVARAQSSVRERGLNVNVDHHNEKRAAAASELVREAYEEEREGTKE